jgi:hypothetical protein
VPFTGKPRNLDCLLNTPMALALPVQNQLAQFQTPLALQL